MELGLVNKLLWSTPQGCSIPSCPMSRFLRRPVDALAWPPLGHTLSFW
uniref:Uncharacterized protein n=1 Tax=Anguilla anguilla TaxID=7936 RepID=A0A0E9Q6I1_ANGAN